MLKEPADTSESSQGSWLIHVHDTAWLIHATWLIHVRDVQLYESWLIYTLAYIWALNHMYTHMSLDSYIHTDEPWLDLDVSAGSLNI